MGERDGLVPVRNTAKSTEHLLLAADPSPATERAVQYLGRIIGRRDIKVHFFYLLHALPPALLEFGGSENPRREEKLESQLRSQQKQWIVKAQEAAQPVLDHVTQILRSAGVPQSCIDVSFSDPSEVSYAVEAVLQAAKSKHCQTVVLGHATHSCFRELTGGDLTDQLVRHAKGFTIWIVQ
jgi:nucleotide-binding universal stress UspA family protein